MKKVMFSMMMAVVMGSAMAAGVNSSDSALERQTKQDKHIRMERVKDYCKAHPKECKTMAENTKIRHNARRAMTSSEAH